MELIKKHLNGKGHCSEDGILQKDWRCVGGREFVLSEDVGKANSTLEERESYGCMCWMDCLVVSAGVRGSVHHRVGC